MTKLQHGDIQKGFCPCCLNECYAIRIPGGGRRFGLTWTGDRALAIFGEIIWDSARVCWWHMAINEGHDMTDDEVMSHFLDDVSHLTPDPVEKSVAATKPPVLTKLEQLQALAEKTPLLQDYAPKVTYTRGQGYHVRRSDGMNTLWFVTFEVGQAYLSAWIGSGRQPSLANIRQGVKHGRTVAHPVESDPQTSVPMPTNGVTIDAK